MTEKSLRPMTTRVGSVSTRPESQEPIRLKHLCPEDKAKIGELLRIMVTERSRSKDCLRLYEKDRKQFQTVVKRLRKQNKAAVKQKETLEKQLEQSLELLTKYQRKESSLPTTRTNDPNPSSLKPIRSPQSANPENIGVQTCGENAFLDTLELAETFGTSKFAVSGKQIKEDSVQTSSPNKENSVRPSAVGEVKSLRRELATLSLSLRQLNSSGVNSGIAEGRLALAPLQLNDSNYGSCRSKLESSRSSTRRNPLLLDSGPTEGYRKVQSILERSRGKQLSPRPNPVATPSTLPSSSMIESPLSRDLPQHYDDSLFDLLDDIEAGSIAHPTPKHYQKPSPDLDSELDYSDVSCFNSAKKMWPDDC